MDICHLTYTSVGRLPFFPDVIDYRKALHKLAGLRHLLALFSMVDEHLHQAAFTNSSAASKVSSSTKRTLAPVTATRFARDTNIRTVGHRGYMEYLLRYFLKQPSKHNSPGHPALWEGSCFLDLIGARLVKGLTLDIRRALPRFQEVDAYEHVGLPRVALTPVDPAVIGEAGALRLASAASAALAARPDLSGNAPTETTARRAIAHLGRWAGLHDSEIAAAMRVDRRSLRRLLARQVERKTLDVVRMRIGLENAVAAATAGPISRDGI